MNRSSVRTHQTGAMGLLTAGHEETARRLSDVIDEELSGFRRSRIERHLRRCEGCRALLRSLAATVERLREFSRRELDPDPAFAERVAVRLRGETAS